MSRMPIMNLCLVLVVITILGLQHSRSVLSLPDTASRGAKSAALFGPQQPGGPLADGLKTSVNYLSDLWQRSMILKQWMLESQSTSWERLRAAPGPESDLVEARFHVANAEVFVAAMGERQRAKTELDRADGYLQHALPTVTSDLLSVVKAIRTEVTDANIELDLGYPDTEITQEQIKADLDRLIQTLKASLL